MYIVLRMFNVKLLVTIMKSEMTIGKVFIVLGYYQIEKLNLLLLFSRKPCFNIFISDGMKIVDL